MVIFRHVDFHIGTQIYTNNLIMCATHRYHGTLWRENEIPP